MSHSLRKWILVQTSIHVPISFSGTKNRARNRIGEKTDSSKCEFSYVTNASLDHQNTRRCNHKQTISKTVSLVHLWILVILYLPALLKFQIKTTLLESERHTAKAVVVESLSVSKRLKPSLRVLHEKSSAPHQSISVRRSPRRTLTGDLSEINPCITSSLDISLAFVQDQGAGQDSVTEQGFIHPYFFADSYSSYRWIRPSPRASVTRDIQG